MTPRVRASQQADQALGQFDRAISGAKAAAIGFGAGMVAAVGTQAVGAVIDFAKASVGAASDLEESISKTSVVFGENADDVQSWADTAATAFGQSEQQALEAASTLGNLFTAMGVTGDAAADMSMELVELASDLASFNNICH